MTDNAEQRSDRELIGTVREAVGAELMDAARARESTPWFRRGRWLTLGAIVAAVLIPGGIAVAELIPKESGHFIESAPPPLFSTEAFGSCPEAVQQTILQLDSLTTIRRLPGIP